LPAPSISEAVNAIETKVLILGVSQLQSLKTPMPVFVEEILSHTKNLCEVWIVGMNDLTRQLSGLRSKKVRVFASFEELDKAMEQME
jgi:hypothetical protein